MCTPHHQCISPVNLYVWGFKPHCLALCGSSGTDLMPPHAPCSQVERHIGAFPECAMVLALGLRPCLMSALLTLSLKRPEKVRGPSWGYLVQHQSTQ